MRPEWTCPEESRSVCRKRAVSPPFRMPVASSGWGRWPGCWAPPWPRRWPGACTGRWVAQVETALGQGLQAGREQLAHLVSRDVQRLDEAGVRESAIETLAENLSDSVVAPLLWFALLGLPGAALYRFANTADAMWGYPGMHGGRHWQWAGKWAAHADDVLNWLPARLTAGLLMLGARRTLWRALPAQAALTPSPNGGWPMGAMALRLGVGLGKPGVYRLNAQAPAPQTVHTWQALRRARFAAWLAVVLCAGGAVLSGPWG